MFFFLATSTACIIKDLRVLFLLRVYSHYVYYIIIITIPLVVLMMLTSQLRPHACIKLS